MYATNKSNKKDLVESKKDLELFIESSSQTEAKGRIQLNYLNENFEGRFIASSNLIKLKTIHPFQGMVAAVAIEADQSIQFLQTNGGLSASGQQYIHYLVFDIFHLYNLFRLKPQALLALYQEALAILREKGAAIEFGKIDPRSDIGIELASWLHAQVKQKFKHSYCSPKGLLYSFQNLLKLYPEDFLPE